MILKTAGSWSSSSVPDTPSPTAPEPSPPIEPSAKLSGSPPASFVRVLSAEESSSNKGIPCSSVWLAISAKLTVKVSVEVGSIVKVISTVVEPPLAAKGAANCPPATVNQVQAVVSLIYIQSVSFKFKASG